MMTVLQREEIRRGQEAHLCEEAMQVFADPKLNYRKMSVLRTALADGIDPDKLKPFAKSWIPAWQIEEFTEELREGNLPVPPKRPFPLKTVLLCLLACAAVLPLLFCGDPKEVPEMELSAEEVRLACGMQFDPGSYIRNVQEIEEAGGTVILPESFTADAPGTKLVQYRQEGAGKRIRKNLRITVQDETAPVLKLKTEKTELLKEAPFSCHSYVFSVSDNIDNDLGNEVVCSDVLDDAETQKVRYSVKDRAGNEASAYLEVHIADYPETLRQADPLPEASSAPAVSYRPPQPQVIEPVLS